MVKRHPLCINEKVEKEGNGGLVEKVLQNRNSFYKFHSVFYVLIIVYVWIDFIESRSLNSVQWFILLALCAVFFLSEYLLYEVLPNRADGKENIRKTCRKLQKILHYVQIIILDAAVINFDNRYLMDVFLLFILLLGAELLAYVQFWEWGGRFRIYLIVGIPACIMTAVRAGAVKMAVFEWAYKLCVFFVMAVLLFMLTELAGRLYDVWLDVAREKEEAEQKVLEMKEMQNKQLEQIQDNNKQLFLKSYEIERANQDIVRTNKQLDAQYRIGTAVLQTFDVDEIIQLLLQAFLDDLNLEAAAVRLRGGIFDSKDRMVIDVCRYSDIKPDRLEEELRKREEEFLSMEEGSYKVEDGMLLIPVFKEEEQIGYLYMLSLEEGYYSEHMINVFLNLTMQFRVGLTNAGIYRQTKELALKDGLTSIYNRRYLTNKFREIAGRVQMDGGRLAVMMMDIDRFKRVNDTYGHLIGDKVLIITASVANEVAEANQGFVGRFGGEEFVVVLPDYTLEAAKKVGEELHRKIGKTSYRDDEVTVKFTVSMGISQYPETCGEAAQLVARADAAMYYSKGHGRNCITVDGTFEEE